MPSAGAITPPMDWEEAGRAWGARPADWAYLCEPYARPANEVIFDQLGVGGGTRLLDIACGSGFAAQLAARRGAAVAGIDASDALVRIARARTADGDFRLGDMFALPFPDACFDVATSFNGIWKGCEAALREAARVLVPGGRLGLTFWGRLDHVGLMPYFLKIIELSPRSHSEASIRQGDTGRPGVIEEMLVSAGFMPRERGTVTVINEWPDARLAVRALAAAGPSVPAIQAAGLGPFCEALREVIEPLHTADAGIRIASEFGWITAELRTVDSLPLRQNGRVPVNMDQGRKRQEHLRGDPRVALDVLDDSGRHTHVSITGHVEEMRADTDLADIDRPARNYTG
jgi:SAM-dependent methyltransferase